jgi:hypothetical protein
MTLEGSYRDGCSVFVVTRDEIWLHAASCREVEHLVVVDVLM